jgi:hypothetical protein
MAIRPYLRVTEAKDGSGRQTFRISPAFLQEIIKEVLEEEEKEDKQEPEKKQAKKTVDVVDSDSSEPDDENSDVPAPEDKEIESDAYGEESKPGDKLSNELVGKTVQSMTMEPSSKLLPGAQEIVLTFNEITDPLRILVGKTGKVSFFFRNSLHNLV